MKRFLAFFLLLCILVPSAHASGSLTLPDPVLFSGGALRYDRQADNEHAMQRWYTVAGDAAAEYALPYIDALKNEASLAYAGSKTENYGDYSGVHHYFTPVNADYSCFSLPNIADNICLDVFYNYGGSYAAHNFVLFFSTDFSLSKSSMPVVAAAKPSAPTATPKPASARDLQDPVSFFGDLITYRGANLDSKKNNYCSFMFRANARGDMSARMVAAYEDYFTRHTALQYSGSVTSKNGEIYRCYTLKNAADSDLLHYSCSTATEQRHEFTASVMLSYEPGYPAIDIHYAQSFNLTDLNYRLDENEHAALSDMAAEYAQKRAKEEASRKVEEEKAAQNQSSGGSSSFSWSSSSSSSSINRTKRCTSCGADGKVSCSNCSGRGYKEKRVSVPNYSGKGAKYENVKETCYRCHGSGTVDCSNCGGDGKVEY